MRITTYLGLLLGVAVVAFAVRTGGGDASLFMHPEALAVVLGGTLAAATLASSRRTVRHALSAASRLFGTPTVTTRQVTEVLVELARQARAEGLGAIDPAALPVRDPFLQAGLHLVAEEVAAERIEELLRRESEILTQRRAQAERLFLQMGRTAPLLGLAGTLLALMELQRALPPGAGPWPALAASLAATCYGLLLAALLFLPLAAKVRTLDLQERLVRDQVVTGLLAIRLGQNPEYVRESLQLFARKNG